MSTRERYRELHWGIESRRDIEARRPAGAPKHHTQLGRLAELHVVTVVTFDEGDEVQLTEGTDGELWLMAPDGVFGGPTGELLRVVYETAKGSKGGRKARPVLYEHEFESDGLAEDGLRPRLAVDADGHLIIERDRSAYHITERGIEG